MEFNTLKNKWQKTFIISTDRENAFDRTQHIFMIYSQQTRYRRKRPQFGKGQQ